MKRVVENSVQIYRNQSSFIEDNINDFINISRVEEGMELTYNQSQNKLYVSEGIAYMKYGSKYARIKIKDQEFNLELDGEFNIFFQINGGDLKISISENIPSNEHLLIGSVNTIEGTIGECNRGTESKYTDSIGANKCTMKYDEELESMVVIYD